MYRRLIGGCFKKRTPEGDTSATLILARSAYPKAEMTGKGSIPGYIQHIFSVHFSHLTKYESVSMLLWQYKLRKPTVTKIYFISKLKKIYRQQIENRVCAVKSRQMCCGCRTCRCEFRKKKGKGQIWKSVFKFVFSKVIFPVSKVKKIASTVYVSFHKHGRWSEIGRWVRLFMFWFPVATGKGERAAVARACLQFEQKHGGAILKEVVLCVRDERSFRWNHEERQVKSARKNRKVRDSRWHND